MKKLYTTLALVLAASVNAQDIGEFESIRPVTTQTLHFTFEIPSTHTFQRIIQRGHASAMGMDADNYDFTGYVGTDGSSTQGIVGVNHETTPGGVSLVSVHFNPENNLWEVDSLRSVDFSQVASTRRNCSGGVTSWGTYITSEESIGTEDSNNDGHRDIGWQVEIDVLTGKIMDYDKDGTPDKLYELGNFSHENIVVSNDGTVAYEGADMGANGYVYKFIPDQARNLSVGDLYVLVANNENPVLATNGEWVQLPNKTPEERNNTVALAEAVGATNFSGVEDVEIGPDGFIYFTAKGTERVYRFKEGSSITEIDTINVHIDNVTFEFGSGLGAGSALFENPDNLAFDNQGNLYTMQDGGNNYIWVTGPNHSNENPDIRIFANTPSGSESTGMTFTPDGKFMFVSIQHPGEYNFIPSRDAAGDFVIFNDDITMVIARREVLGDEATSTVGIQDQARKVALNVFPNPVSNKSQLQYTAKIAGKAQLTIAAVDGKLQSTKTIELLAGENNIKLETENLVSGQYVALLRVNGVTLSSIFLKN